MKCSINPNRPSAKNALAFQAAETVSILIFNLSHSFLPDQRIRIKSSRISEKCSPVNPKSFLKVIEMSGRIIIL